MADCVQVISILSEIKSALDSMRGSGTTTALVGMTGVVVGSVVTGTFQLWVRRASAQSEQTKLLTQLKADVISKQRQQWMDSIREAAKDLIAEYDLIYNFLQSKQGSQERFDELFFSSMSKSNLIGLKLNPDKPAHQAVIVAIEQIQNLLQVHSRKPTADNDKTYHEARIALIAALRALFRETWLKIKALET